MLFSLFFLISERKKSYPPLIFNSAILQSAASQKHLGLILGSKFDFHDDIDNEINNCN